MPIKDPERMHHDVSAAARTLLTARLLEVAGDTVLVGTSEAPGPAYQEASQALESLIGDHAEGEPWLAVEILSRLVLEVAGLFSLFTGAVARETGLDLLELWRRLLAAIDQAETDRPGSTDGPG